MIRDYRRWDVQHGVLPTNLPFAKFYEELMRTRQIAFPTGEMPTRVDQARFYIYKPVVARATSN